MHRDFAPLPPLPFPIKSDYPLFPIDGHGSQKAAMALRTLIENADLKHYPFDAFKKILKITSADMWHHTRNDFTIVGLSFDDKTLILGALIGSHISIYPQPLTTAGPLHPSNALRDMNISEYLNIHTALTSTSKCSKQPLGLGPDALHLTGWTSLSLYSLSHDKGSPHDIMLTHIENLLAAFPPKTITPPKRRGASPMSLSRSLAFRIVGRMLKWDGTTTKPIVVIDPRMRYENPEWSIQITKNIMKIITHPDVCPDPLFQVRQVVSSRPDEPDTFVKPMDIFNGFAPIRPPSSAHHRLKTLASLPEGVLT
jgi:hypothetical protein